MNPSLLDIAQIGWSPTQVLFHAEGACEQVLGAPPSKLIGRSLADALAISSARAEQLHRLAAGQGGVEFVRTHGAPHRWLRLKVGQQDGAHAAGVMDLGQVLSGAPPVQISRLSSSLSHEIRNPLSSVKMAVQTLARNTGLSERDQRRLVIANREIRTMERMLWLFSEYGRDSLPNMEPIALRSLVVEAAALIEPELAERQVVLRLKEEGGLKVRVDSARLRPVLAQLILNVAMGLAPQSEVELEVSRSESGPTLWLADPSATFPSLDDEPVLFQPFGSMLARGAGLSLATLYRVMLGHGGSVRAEPGAPGTLYVLTFPAD